MLVSSVILSHLIFFLVGIFQDIFITYYLQMVAKEIPWRAAIFSTLVTLINLLVLYKILTGIEEQVITIILAYAIGNGVGTVMVIKKREIKKFFFGK